VSVAQPPDRIGEYEILRPLGKPGGFGAVYEARAPNGQLIALKVFHAEVLDGTDRVRLDHEIKALQEVRHPNVASYVDSGKAETSQRTYHYIVMDLLDGRSLRQVLDQDGKLSPARAMDIGRQVARGLEALHDRGIVHRDLKPQNVMICNDGRVVLVDFGVSRFLDYSTITRDGVFVGTLRYAAPEQLSGEAVPASDFHALGALLFEILTGRRAFDARGEFQLLQQIRESVPDPIGAFADVPAFLEQLVAQLLEKEPLDRPGTAGAVADALAPVMRVPQGGQRAPYPRHHSPRVFIRVRYDVEAAVAASLAGAVPDALIVNIRDRSPKPLTLARRTAQYHGIHLGIDPMLMRMGFARWANMESLRNLVYSPEGLAPHLPRHFASRASTADLARAVIEAQSDAGATMGFAAHFAVGAREDDWQRRNASLLAASLEAGKAFDLPVWAVAAVVPEAVCSPDDQTEYVNRLVRGEPAGWLVCVDGFGARATQTTLLWTFRLALLLQERGTPAVLARATSLRRLAFALGIGVEIGLGRYDGFRYSDMRDGGGAGHSPPYFEIPELLCSLPPDVALKVLRSGVLPKCECVSCTRSGTPEEQVAAAGAHNAAVAMAERDALALTSPIERALELREQIVGAVGVEARLRQRGALERALPHLRLWPKVLDQAGEMGLLGEGRLARRLSA
jgi:hypothetical protein